jgi:hypothetical protein
MNAKGIGAEIDFGEVVALCQCIADKRKSRWDFFDTSGDEDAV